MTIGFSKDFFSNRKMSEELKVAETEESTRDDKNKKIRQNRMERFTMELARL